MNYHNCSHYFKIIIIVKRNNKNMLYDTCVKCGKTPCSLIRDESEIYICFDCGDAHDGPNRENLFRSYRSYVAQLYQRTLGRHKHVPLPNYFVWVVRNRYPEDDVSTCRFQEISR